MLSKILWNLDLYRRFIGVHFRSQLQYRFSFLLDALGTFVVTGLEFSALALVFQRFDDIEGWTLGEVAFLYGLVEMAFGVMDMIFSGFDPRDFGKWIRRGMLDQVMLRPVSVTVQVLGSDFALRRVGRIILGIIIFSYALGALDISWTFAKLAYLPLVLVGMVLYFGGLFIVGATITFWTVEAVETINILTYGGSYLISYPMHIYDTWLRRLFTYFIPAIFLNYYPALYFLDKPDPFGLPAFGPFLSPLAGLLIFIAALAFWRYGLKQYQSTGT